MRKFQLLPKTINLGCSMSDQLSLVRRLERDFPVIEEAGCKVGIGVAKREPIRHSSDFITTSTWRKDRKLPLAMTRDLNGAAVKWRGYGVINPFSSDGRLVALEDYPKLRRYLEERRPQIAGRHIAQKNQSSWYRTIDRI